MTRQETKQNKFCVFLRIILRSSAIMSLFFAWISIANGAQLNLVSPVSEIGIGQQFQVDLVLDAEGESINALEGQILFPADLLELREVREGNSIMSFWIEPPKAAEGNKIIFSGIIPGGYEEKKGFLFSAVFLGKKEGEGAVAIRESRALKNDGLGTSAAVKISDFLFSLSAQPATTTPELAKIKDYDPPEEFKPEIAQSEDIFDGKYFLVFAAKDKGRGLAKYEVREVKQKFFSFLFGWKETASPYLLADQKLKSYVYVKAVDKDGNERIISLSPQKPLFWYENYLFYVIIIIVISAIIAYKIWRNSRRKLNAKIP